jgi:hypothetical protein
MQKHKLRRARTAHDDPISQPFSVPVPTIFPAYPTQHLYPKPPGALSPHPIPSFIHFLHENTKAIHGLVGYHRFFFTLCKSFHLFKAVTPQQTNVAPPVSIASISARSMGARRNRAGSSLRSKYSPFTGATEPRECPETEPTSPVFARPRGPCCWAVCL